MPDGSRLSAATSPTLRADPLADATMARIFATAGGDGVPADEIALVNREIATWTNNAVLTGWRAAADVPAPIAAALEDFVREAHALPGWADPARIASAERTFMDIGMLSCTLLFCASLPECYVMPDLADVLHAAGQLEAHTDYRVRSTAAMIFPVMLRGGLCDATGAGLAQVLKVRLIHATIRHLVLRGSPEQALGAAAVPPLPAAGRGMHGVLHALGWDTAARGLPCNQQELAYTLLTFSYVFLRALRQLGLGLPPAQEEAYLHAWNVVGHVLGIERALMAGTMEEARSLFDRLQAEGDRQPRLPDPRPALAAALLATMERNIPLPLLRSFPLQLTRYLCGKTAARALGLKRHSALPARLLFLACLGTIRAIDTVVRVAVPDFSLSRMFTRVLGYRLTARMLMDQTRPLRLPDALLDQVGCTLHCWHTDPKAPGWLNRCEARLAGRKPEGQ
ncbi:oxygenase MpaB family protein [Massilia sp. METH4]|uniref:oxygenase MpaB family protein n=1 Tax=Massilia sp. METH4 TaxID=3123041 RepID=UPI0030CDFBE4